MEYYHSSRIFPTVVTHLQIKEMFISELIHGLILGTYSPLPIKNKQKKTYSNIQVHVSC